MEKLTDEQLKIWRDVAAIDGANSVIELIDNLSEARRELATLKESTRWVPVEERLPEDGVWVYQIAEPGGIGFGYIEKGHWYAHTENHTLIGKVTHWQPIQPLPPVEVSNGS
jgi:hypothetical protein